MKQKLETPELVKPSDHVIVQRLDFKKVYRAGGAVSLTLGNEVIMMNEIINKPFWTSYKVVSLNDDKTSSKKSKKFRSLSTLVAVDRCDSMVDLKKNVSTSGHDNRTINDDGKSQKLSKEDLVGFKDAGKSGREIVSSLIENNASFGEKTEYSQEKYIKKKEKKYCQYLTIHKPTIRALQEIYLKQDPAKIYGLRMDTLAQLLSYSDVKNDGTFLLYDSGTAGLVPAAMLSRIGDDTNGKLIYLHSGDHLPQMPIVRSMNFSLQQSERLMTVSIFDFFKKFYNNDDDLTLNNDVKLEIVNETVEKNEDNVTIVPGDGLKRKITTDGTNEGPLLKKSRKILEIERSVDHMSENKADSLTIVTKEHPLNLIKGLLPFVKSSRPFVIYHQFREPLEETYVFLKQESDVINLKLFSNFLRSYQVLPERTHPEIMTNDSGGYLLTGYTGETHGELANK